jgi:hypothetical protein
MSYRRRYFDGQVTTPAIVEGAVTSDKIADETIESCDIKNKAIQTEDIADGAVTLAKLGSDVPAVGIPDNSITASKLANNSVEKRHIKSAAVDTSELANQSVTTTKIRDGAVTPEKLSFAGGFNRYVPRAVATWDKTRMNFEFDGVLHEDGMDLSAIVPVDAVAIHLIIEVSGPQGESFQIYANQGAKICNSFIGFIQGMGGGLGRVHCVIYNDPDRLFDYLLTPGIGDVAVAVAGWFI